MDVIETDKNN